MNSSHGRKRKAAVQYSDDTSGIKHGTLKIEENALKQTKSEKDVFESIVEPRLTRRQARIACNANTNDSSTGDASVKRDSKKLVSLANSAGSSSDTDAMLPIQNSAKQKGSGSPAVDKTKKNANKTLKRTGKQNREPKKVNGKDTLDEGKFKVSKVDTCYEKDKIGTMKLSPAKKAKVILKGCAPVDSFVDQNVYEKTQVYSEGGDIYDVMLNQTNVAQNNNKYFLLQLLKDDNLEEYYVWFRWGRVGYNGQSKLNTCHGDLEKAKEIFCTKFSDKTMNCWEERNDFIKVAGKYDMVRLDYQQTDDEISERNVGKPQSSKANPKVLPEPESQLDFRLQDLLNLICNIKDMEQTVTELEFDSNRLPLGKLTQGQINAGYQALKIVEKCLLSGGSSSELLRASSEFYTRIPHCFGMRVPPVIRTNEMLKAKIELLAVLGDIEVAIRTLSSEVSGGSMNQLDQRYADMECKLDPLDPSSQQFHIVTKYLQTTHAPTHKYYTMNVRNVFAVTKKGEAERFNDVGNKMLLWHGSRRTNYYSIFSRGLRIAPPEAPVTGYMFGKGVYFADVSSKSANYCYATKAQNTGILVLCEVALGKWHELVKANYKADKLPHGYHSVKGLGRTAPDSSEYKTLDDGVVVPMGRCLPTCVNNQDGYTLQYNEYVVYNTNQIKMKYIVVIDFAYDD